MTTFASKLCHRCGSDVSAGERFEDASGHSFCANCWRVRPLSAARPSVSPAAVLPRYRCSYCQAQVRASEVHFIGGDVACPSCYTVRTFESQHPVAVCASCQGSFAADLMSVFDHKRVCPDCREELRIGANQAAHARRTAIEASRPMYLSSTWRRVGGDNPVSSLVGGLLALAMIAAVTVVVTRGGMSITGSRRIAVFDETKQTTEYLSREEARERVMADPAFSIERDGQRLTRAEALRFLGE